ncbi:uncharacterized protein FTOL_10245 [Fusarium torulosum]|uniref:Uncharacterized protein n=1 Tax=Fusarium torulosum TaxID=33205 RepID=A0AAE8MH89_9HYPO|nr:uncharacterized protein FTOL_10245 [Fusarium torulosum]
MTAMSHSPPLSIQESHMQDTVIQVILFAKPSTLISLSLTIQDKAKTTTCTQSELYPSIVSAMGGTQQPFFVARPLHVVAPLY